MQIYWKPASSEDLLLLIDSDSYAAALLIAITVLDTLTTEGFFSPSSLL